MKNITHVLFIYLLSYIFTSYANVTYVNESEVENNKIMKHSDHGVYFENRIITNKNK